MSRKIDTTPDWKAILVGLLTASVFGLGGFFLFRDGGMGSALFLLLPAASGFAVAVTTKPARILTTSLIIALILSLSILLLTGLEGWICVLMALPLIVFGMTVGGFCGYFFRKRMIDSSKFPQTIKFIVLLIAPVFLIGAHSAEQYLIDPLRDETFVTTVSFNAGPDQVWETLKSAESVEASKPFLLKMGLPVPVRCELEKEGVGSRRICYFDSGYIEERITEWNPPNSMKMEVIETNLPNKHWLSFKDASYEIRQEGGNTIVTRRTTIVSRLRPAWYWRPLEGLGVEAEHRYLFEYVSQKLLRGE